MSLKAKTQFIDETHTLCLSHCLSHCLSLSHTLTWTCVGVHLFFSSSFSLFYFLIISNSLSLSLSHMFLSSHDGGSRAFLKDHRGVFVRVCVCLRLQKPLIPTQSEHSCFFFTSTLKETIIMINNGLW